MKNKSNIRRVYGITKDVMDYAVKCCLDDLLYQCMTVSPHHRYSKLFIELYKKEPDFIIALTRFVVMDIIPNLDLIPKVPLLVETDDKGKIVSVKEEKNEYST